MRAWSQVKGESNQVPRDGIVLWFRTPDYYEWLEKQPNECSEAFYGSSRNREPPPYKPYNRGDRWKGKPSGAKSPEALEIRRKFLENV